MKKTFILLSTFILLVSCSKNDSKDNSNVFTKITNDSIRNYSSPKGTTLQLTNTTWYTEKIYGFGNLNLIISGSTNADRVTILTRGDGLLADYNVTLNSNNEFINDTIGILFTHAPSNDFVSTSTEIKVYKDLDTLVVKLKSGQLKY